MKLKNESLSEDLYLKAYDSFVYKGDIGKAIENYSRVIFHDPGNAGAYYDLGYLYYLQGRDYEAAYYFENYLRCQPYAADKKEVEALISTLKLKKKAKVSVRFIKSNIVI